MNGDNAELIEIAEGIDRGVPYGGFPMREPDKRRNPNGRVVDIKRLWNLNKEVLQLNSLGYKGSEIAKMLGITEATVSNTLNSTLGKGVQLGLREIRDKEYEALRDDVIELTKRSIDVYYDILESEEATSKLRKDTADTIVLELSGLRVPTRIESKSLHAILTAEEIADFKRRGLEAAKASGKLVEVEGESKVR